MRVAALDLGNEWRGCLGSIFSYSVAAANYFGGILRHGAGYIDAGRGL